MAYLSLEEEFEKVQRNMANFGVDLGKAQESGNLMFIKTDPYHIREYLEKGTQPMLDDIMHFKPHRIIFDSLSGFAVQYETESQVRSNLGRLIYLMQKWREQDETPTVLFTVDATEQYYTNVEEFLVDGVIKLKKIQSGKEVSKVLQITKMRGTDFKTEMAMYRIVDGKGIVLEPEAPILGL